MIAYPSASSSPTLSPSMGRAVEATAEGHAASLKPFQRQPSHPSFDELEHDEWAPVANDCCSAAVWNDGFRCASADCNAMRTGE